jgi:hypothetical protein
VLIVRRPTCFIWDFQLIQVPRGRPERMGLAGCWAGVVRGGRPLQTTPGTAASTAVRNCEGHAAANVQNPLDDGQHDIVLARQLADSDQSNWSVALLARSWCPLMLTTRRTMSGGRMGSVKHASGRPPTRATTIARRSMSRRSGRGLSGGLVQSRSGGNGSPAHLWHPASALDNLLDAIEINTGVECLLPGVECERTTTPRK